MIADQEEQLELANAGLSKKEASSPDEVKGIRKQIDHTIQDLDDTITWLEKS